MFATSQSRHVCNIKQTENETINSLKLFRLKCNVFIIKTKPTNFEKLIK